MKINFDDGSFLAIEPQHDEGRLLTISMCGLTNGGKKATMSTSMLTLDDVEQVIDFLTEWKKAADAQKNVAKDA